MENLLRAENPFTAPTPVFKSPRNLGYMASAPVSRSWTQPSGAVFKRSSNRSGDQTNACTTPGYRVTGYVGNSINNAVYYPTSPLLGSINLSLQTVTIYWCGVRESVTVRELTLFDERGQRFRTVTGSSFIIDQGDGMITVNMPHDGESTDYFQKVRFIMVGGSNIQLEEGGALSVSY